MRTRSGLVESRSGYAEAKAAERCVPSSVVRAYVYRMVLAQCKAARRPKPGTEHGREDVARNSTSIYAWHATQRTLQHEMQHQSSSVKTSTSTTPSSGLDRNGFDGPAEEPVLRKTSLLSALSELYALPQYKHVPVCPLSTCVGLPHSGQSPSTRFD